MDFFNSGTNPNNPVCISGREYWDSKNYPQPVEASVVVNNLKEDYKNGVVTREQYVQWMAFTRSAAKDPNLFIQWGTPEYLDEYRVVCKQNIILETNNLDEAKKVLKEHIEDHLYILNIVKVSKVVKASKGIMTQPINSLDQIDDTHTYFVHNHNSGIQEELTGRENVISKIQEFYDARVKKFICHYSLEQKVIDPDVVDYKDVDFSAWKKLELP